MLFFQSPYPMEGFYKKECEEAEENKEPYKWPEGDDSGDEQSGKTLGHRRPIGSFLGIHCMMLQTYDKWFIAALYKS